ncbi:MAG: PAS domain S-box protein, partial [Desulfobacterales bacterium]|nr:PAS domain S-box protein [Desulfobacterales bacterium]
MKSAFLKYRFVCQCSHALVLVALFFLASGIFAGETLAVENTTPAIRSAAAEVLLYTGLIVGSLVLLFFIFFLWWWSLRKQVAQKTQELKDSTDRFRFVFEAANVGKSIILPTGEIDANEVFAELLGYTRSELNQKRWQDITQTEDIPLTEKAIAPLLAGEKDAARFEKRYVHKSGDLRWADVSLAIRRDVDGKPLYFVATVADITERKHAEEALIESEEKYRLLAKHSEDIIFTLDTELKYTYISPAVKTLRGYAPAELIGKPIDESLTSDSLSLAAKIFSEELKTANEKGPVSRTARVLELQMNCKDGSKIWVEVKASFLRDRDGNIAGILGVTRDISDRRKAEQALRESEERLQAILESNANPIVVYDAEGVPQYLNPAFVNVFGWTLDELKGRRIPFVPEDQKEITAVKIGEIYATGEPVKFASRRLTKRGETLDVIVSAAIVKGTEGQGIGMVVNLTDITEQRKLEIQLRQAQKMESVGRLAGGVAHDYNNMLSVILGYTEMALDQVSPDDPLHEDLSEVLAAARRSADIT